LKPNKAFVSHALLELGGFDEDYYFCYGEDVDLGFRLRLAGHRCLYLPQYLAHHVGSGTTASTVISPCITAIAIWYGLL
jgi:GT2 family glycosyltransferase